MLASMYMLKSISLSVSLRLSPSLEVILARSVIKHKKWARERAFCRAGKI